jgi:hypothetical protein
MAKVECLFVLSLGGEFLVSYLQEGGSPILTWLPFGSPPTELFYNYMKFLNYMLLFNQIILFLEIKHK